MWTMETSETQFLKILYPELVESYAWTSLYKFVLSSRLARTQFNHNLHSYSDQKNQARRRRLSFQLSLSLFQTKPSRTRPTKPASQQQMRSAATWIATVAYVEGFYRESFSTFELVDKKFPFHLYIIFIFYISFVPYQEKRHWQILKNHPVPLSTVDVGKQVKSTGLL